MAWSLVLLVLAHLCWLQLRLGSPLRQAYILATQSGSARIITTRPSEAFGQIARETGDGNVFLELAGCARTNRCFENSLGYFYFRANYALYPRQLYVAPAGAVINNGTDIMRAGFVPDRQWLQDHNIRSVLTYDGKDGGETPQLEFLQHDQHGAGIKANPAGGKPMALLACGFYLLLIVLVGYVVVSAIYPAQRMKAIQLATFSAAAGAGSTGLLLFWTSLAGFAPSRNLLLVIAGFALASLVALNKNGRLISADKLPGQSEKKEFWAIIPVSLILLALAVVATHSLLTPLEEWDAFAIWGLKAKVLAHAALRPVPPYFHDLSLSYSHLDYPLMLPFLTAGAYAAMGGADDQSGKLISVFLDVLVVPVVYLGLRWKLPSSRCYQPCSVTAAPVAPTCRWRCFMRAAFFLQPNGWPKRNGRISCWPSCSAASPRSRKTKVWSWRWPMASSFWASDFGAASGTTGLEPEFFSRACW